jgi:hypothetical protein
MGNVSSFYFTHTATVQRPTVTKAKAGGAKRAWASVEALSDIPVCIQPASANDVNLFSSRNLIVSHALYMESDPGIRKGDRILVSDGRIFVVRGSINFVSFDTLFKVMCRELLS